jgi:putative transposase
MIDGGALPISMRRQCALIGLHRSTFYAAPVTASAFHLQRMRLIDEQYTQTPFDGWPRMTAHVRRLGLPVNHKRVQRVMRPMGLQAIYPKPRTSTAANDHTIYPYLLGAVAMSRANQVWSADITYVRMSRGFMYLVAVIDWWSRDVLAWRLSNTLDVACCLEALEEALVQGCPEVFNTDQGVQFTSLAFTSRLERAGVAISMDGRGRALDHIFVERLWRTVKYEDIRVNLDLWYPRPPMKGGHGHGNVTVRRSPNPPDRGARFDQSHRERVTAVGPPI